MRRKTFTVSLLIVLLALSLSIGIRAQGGGPSLNGELHSADPCEQTPDDPGKANGVQNGCKRGGSSGVVKGDFNGDGIADLAVGVPNETRTNLVFSGSLSTGFIDTDETGAGAVNIIFGSSSTTGLGSAGTQIVDQNPLLVSKNAHFGTALVAGKFKSITSTVSDLAVGAPGVVKDGKTGSPGAVYVYTNFGSGVTSALGQPLPTVLFAADITNIGPAFNGFGVAFPSDMSMTWGDFNGDGFGDLAVEVRGGAGCTTCVSGVVVYFGGPFGLSSSNHQVYDVDDGLSWNNFSPPTGCPTTTSVTSGNHFCAISRGNVSLGAADLDGDGKDELLIGAPGCSMINDNNSVLTFDQGCVAIVPGRSPQPDVFFHWSVLVGDKSKGFGSSIAVGDFNGDGSKDVAVGQPGTAVQLTTVVNGSVRVFSHVQLTSFPIPITTTTLINQDTAGIGGTQSNGLFGATLATNDFNGDGVSDLAIGAPGETVSGNANSGVVNVIYGLSGTGLSTASSVGRPAAQTIAGDASSSAGSSLTAWNFGKSAQPDLVVGEPLLNVIVTFPLRGGGFTSITVPGAGGVRAFYGGLSTGLNVSVEQRLTQGSVSGEGAQSGNHFGSTVY